jgi:Transposase
MKKRFSEEQIVNSRRETESGVTVKDLCRRHGFRKPPFTSGNSGSTAGVAARGGD